MDDVDHWFKPIDQFAISFAKLFEFFGCVLEYLQDVIGRAARSKAVGKGVSSQVYPDLPAVVGKSCIEDWLK